MKYRITAMHLVEAESPEEAFRLLARFETDIVFRQTQQWGTERLSPGVQVQIEDVKIEDADHPTQAMTAQRVPYKAWFRMLVDLEPGDPEVPLMQRVVVDRQLGLPAGQVYTYHGGVVGVMPPSAQVEVIRTRETGKGAETRPNGRAAPTPA